MVNNESSTFISINDFDDKANQSLFISSEVDDSHPFVHHLYIRHGSLHYLVYDPVDDVVLDHFSGEKLNANLFEYESSGYLSFFHLQAFTHIGSITHAQCSYYPPHICNDSDTDSEYKARIYEDITLIMNRAQLESAGYLMEAHLLGNSITGVQFKSVLVTISDCVSDRVTHYLGNDEDSDHDMAKLLLRHMDVIDEVVLSIANEIPIPKDTIIALKKAVLSGEILNAILVNKDFERLEGIECLDKMFGQRRFSSDSAFIGKYENLPSTL